MGRRSRILPVANFNHRHEAELARGYLEEAGIPAALSADDGGGAFGLPIATAGAGFPTLFVREADMERARQILEETGMVGHDGETDR